MDNVIINVLMGLLGLLSGSTISVVWISKQVNRNKLHIAEDRRDLKTAFAQIDENKESARICQKIHSETMAVVKSILDQNNILIHKFEGGN